MSKFSAVETSLNKVIIAYNQAFDIYQAAHRCDEDEKEAIKENYAKAMEKTAEAKQALDEAYQDLIKTKPDNKVRYQLHKLFEDTTFASPYAGGPKSWRYTPKN